jgi:hypothetical protein
VRGGEGGGLRGSEGGEHGAALPAALRLFHLLPPPALLRRSGLAKGRPLLVDGDLMPWRVGCWAGFVVYGGGGRGEGGEGVGGGGAAREEEEEEGEGAEASDGRRHGSRRNWITSRHARGAAAAM